MANNNDDLEVGGVGNGDDDNVEGMTDDIPVKYTPQEVAGRLTNDELDELNALVDDFDDFAGDENDERYKRWLELDRRASGL